MVAGSGSDGSDVEVLSWLSAIDNKAIKETDSEIENTLMKAGKAESLDFVKLYSDVTDWADSLCVWL